MSLCDITWLEYGRLEENQDRSLTQPTLASPRPVKSGKFIKAF